MLGELIVFGLIGSALEAFSKQDQQTDEDQILILLNDFLNDFVRKSIYNDRNDIFDFVLSKGFQNIPNLKKLNINSSIYRQTILSKKYKVYELIDYALENKETIDDENRLILKINKHKKRIEFVKGPSAVESMKSIFGFGEMSEPNKLVKEHLDIAVNFIKNSNFNDAKQELVEAYNIEPGNELVAIKLSFCYLKLFEITKEPRYLSLAENYAKTTLSINPNNDLAGKIISEIKLIEKQQINRRQRKAKLEKQKNRDKFVGYIALMIFIIAIIAIIMLLVLNK